MIVKQADKQQAVASRHQQPATSSGYVVFIQQTSSSSHPLIFTLGETSNIKQSDKLKLIATYFEVA
jgi:hypothetical protein